MYKNITAVNTGLRELYPLFCGFEECQKGHFYGPAVRSFFIIHCVRNGKGTFTSGEKTYRLSKGKCFCIRPNEIAFYKADEIDPWDYTWIAFNGENAGLFLESTGFCYTPVFGTKRIFAIFEELHRQIQSGTIDGERNEFSMLSLLYAFFAELPKIVPVESHSEQYVRKVHNYVENMISGPITVEHLAAFCGLDRHYLCRIFKAQTGKTLQEYIIGCKMQKAKQMLVYTSLNIGNIARSVGYSDVYNFSKMFKKYHGVSPLKFRKSQPLHGKMEVSGE